MFSAGWTQWRCVHHSGGAGGCRQLSPVGSCPGLPRESLNLAVLCWITGCAVPTLAGFVWSCLTWYLANDHVQNKRLNKSVERRWDGFIHFMLSCQEVTPIWTASLLLPSRGDPAFGSFLNHTRKNKKLWRASVSTLKGCQYATLISV